MSHGRLQKVELLSVPDYLSLEERSDERHEYVAGVIYAMVGSTARHNLISTAIVSNLREYVLVAQDKVKVDVYRRTGDGWQLESVTCNESVALDSIGFHAQVETFYEDLLGAI